MVFEYMDGGSLQDLINDNKQHGQLVEKDIAHIIKQILLGLNYLH